MKATIETFYEAFKNLDAEAMVNCYHDAVVFEDPAFGVLKDESAKGMWRMLCASQKNKNFKVVVSNIEAHKTLGSAHWEAFYTFSKTGRKVHNKVEAQFQFKDGLIIKHSDNFNLHHWAKQALGFKGFLLGGTSYFSSKLKVQTNKMLNNYLNEKKAI
ncbi:MAG: nuclear transport factor 2 family protein [Winogradskyella sp.]